MSNVAIRVDGLSKRYRIGSGMPRYGRLTESLWNAVQAPFSRIRGDALAIEANEREHIWALKDVSFEIKEGDLVGIIGRNGAGKTTLLKVLSRITEPSEGYAEIRGRVGSLLEVGTGFHPELSGRDNIFLNGAILGMGRAEIVRKFDEIVEFAEMAQFIDTPVKRYSSGMQVRLAFAVAAHLEPDILLVDEVLAVGDADFQQKCIGRMGDVAREGRTVLFVSHNMGAIRSLCQIAYLVERGCIICHGVTSAVMSQYQARTEELISIPIRERDDRGGRGWSRVVDVKFENDRGMPVGSFLSGDTLRIVLGCKSSKSASGVRFLIGLYDQWGSRLALLDSEVTNSSIRLEAGDNEIVCEVPSLSLIAGLYTMNVAIMEAGDVVDHVTETIRFRVDAGDFFGTGRQPAYGPLLLRHIWRVRSEKSEDLASSI